jgi:hypothetical protein
MSNSWILFQVGTKLFSTTVHKCFKVSVAAFHPHERWVLDYVAHNEEIEQSLHSISMDLRKLENYLYDIEIRDEINMAPMKSYIEEWFQHRMDNLVQEGQQPVDRTPMTIDDNNKNASAS